MFENFYWHLHLWCTFGHHSGLENVYVLANTNVGGQIYFNIHFVENICWATKSYQNILKFLKLTQSDPIKDVQWGSILKN